MAELKINFSQKLKRAFWTVKIYRKAIFWSFIVSLTVIMDGFDDSIPSLLFAFPPFQKRFGDYSPLINDFEIPASWQFAFLAGSKGGSIVGTLAGPFLVKWMGQKRTLIVMMMVLAPIILLSVFANGNRTMLFVGQTLGGFPIAIFGTVAPSYASEALPRELRAYMTSYTYMCFVLGELLAAGCLLGLVSYDGPWPCAIPFAVQWTWFFLITPFLFFLPESPWYLVQAGRLQDARKSLERLQCAPVHEALGPQVQASDSDASTFSLRSGKKSLSRSSHASTESMSFKHPTIDESLEEIVRTNSEELASAVGSGYLDCFRGTELRRTEIACISYAGKIFAGVIFGYNSSYYLKQLGFATALIYRFQIIGACLSLSGCLLSWAFLIPYFGRRGIYMGGCAALMASLFVIGAVFHIGSTGDGFGTAQAAVTLFYTLVFSLTLGQISATIIAEIGSTRLRNRTIALARLARALLGIGAIALQMHMMNPTAWNIKGYAGFAWGGTTFGMLVWAFFRVPEIRGRSFEEINKLFQMRIPARHFKRTNLDAIETEG